MNLTVPSFHPGLPFGPAATAGVSGRLPSFAEESRGLRGDRVDLISFVPFEGFTLLMLFFVIVSLRLRCV
jgi:hypothetical protein